MNIKDSPSKVVTARLLKVAKTKSNSSISLISLINNVTFSENVFIQTLNENLYELSIIMEQHKILLPNFTPVKSHLLFSKDKEIKKEILLFVKHFI